jgi:DNA-binding IclR family transcriptional regulator
MPAPAQSPKSPKSQKTLLNLGIEMVRHLAHSGRSLGVTEIAKRMELPKSSVFRILGVLGELGFVQKGETSGRYSVSPAIFSFVYELTHHFGPSSRFDTILREWSVRWNCSLYVCMLSGTHSYVVSASGPSGGTHALGSHCPVYASSAGKVIVSRLDESEWPEYAPVAGGETLTAFTNLDAEKFYRELRVACEQGVAWNIRETTASDVSVAAFVPEPDQSPRLAVALLVPYKDLLVHDRGKLAERALEIAALLAKETRAVPLRLAAVMPADGAARLST